MVLPITDEKILVILIDKKCNTKIEKMVSKDPVIYFVKCFCNKTYSFETCSKLGKTEMQNNDSIQATQPDDEISLFDILVVLSENTRLPVIQPRLVN